MDGRKIRSSKKSAGDTGKKADLGSEKCDFLASEKDGSSTGSPQKADRWKRDSTAELQRRD